jgi:hypothetical protein
MTNHQRNLSWLILFALLILSIIGNIILFKMWTGERRSAEDFEKRVTHSQKEIASLTARIGTIEQGLRLDSMRFSESMRSREKTIVALRARKVPLRAGIQTRISQDSAVARFVALQDMEILQLNSLVATQDSSLTVQIKGLRDVISLERLKSSQQQVLISDLGGENQALKREVKKERRGKFAFKTATGILVVGLAILFSQ